MTDSQTAAVSTTDDDGGSIEPRPARWLTAPEVHSLVWFSIGAAMSSVVWIGVGARIAMDHLCGR